MIIEVSDEVAKHLRDMCVTQEDVCLTCEQLARQINGNFITEARDRRNRLYRARIKKNKYRYNDKPVL